MLRNIQILIKININKYINRIECIHIKINIIEPINKNRHRFNKYE